MQGQNSRSSTGGVVSFNWRGHFSQWEPEISFEYHLLLYKAASYFQHFLIYAKFILLGGLFKNSALYPPAKCELLADNRHFLNSARMYPLPGFSAASCARYLLAGQLCIGWKISEPSLHPKFARVSCPGGQWPPARHTIAQNHLFSRSICTFT